MNVQNKHFSFLFLLMRMEKQPRKVGSKFLKFITDMVMASSEALKIGKKKKNLKL